jgi:hypothetical protein
MTTERRSPPSSPIFSLSLGENGGTLGPTTEQELISYLSGEIKLWNWISNRNSGNHENRIRESLAQLNSALAQAQELPHYKISNPDHWRNLVTSIEASLRSVFIDRNFPHSNTPLANEIEAIRQEHGDAAASFYAAVKLDQPGQNYQPADLSSWIGFFEALGESKRSNANRKLLAASKTLDNLVSKFETTLGEKKESLGQIHRDFESVQASMLNSQASSKAQFDLKQEERENFFQEQIGAHQEGMAAIRKAFKEEISLRAPAQYWRSKRTAHRIIAVISGIMTFGAIGGCAYFLTLEIKALLVGTPTGTTPEHWRIAVLALVSLFSVWAVRLIVRIFLSQLHLVTDASERIVMLETYLSLTEGNQLTDDGERKLILTSLFRPASDGIVKDEGIPPSLLDLLTRNSKP